MGTTRRVWGGMRSRSTVVINDATDAAIARVVSEKCARPLCGGSVVGAEKSTNTLAPANGTADALPWWTIDQFVVEPLVVPFTVVVRDKIRERPPNWLCGHLGIQHMTRGQAGVPGAGMTGPSAPVKPSLGPHRKRNALNNQ
jgi:hypothetical protein